MSERKLKEALDNTTYAGIPMLIYQRDQKTNDIFRNNGNKNEVLQTEKRRERQ